MNKVEQDIHDRLMRYSEYGCLALGYTEMVLGDDRKSLRYSDRIRLEAFEEKYEYKFPDAVRESLLKLLHHTRGERLKCVYAQQNAEVLVAKVRRNIMDMWEANKLEDKLPRGKERS